ncbi:MAG: hypothetical protein QOC93_2931 [Actinomycetota bacterium]|jgi:hypothetical protein|nr:hypothetical protein [Actinomycetota bacterium]
MSVDFEHLPEPTYATLLSALLHRIHPNAEIIDGSGGDGGRDVQVCENGRLTIYELKSFNGRLDSKSGRRAQVESSLREAAQHQPDEWFLVVPINHTPSELKWFNGLRGDYSFVQRWRERTWIDEQLSKHPDLVRHFVTHPHTEVLDRLKELNSEKAVLAGGIPDLLARVKTLEERAAEISPNYGIEFNSTRLGVEIGLFPKGSAVQPIRVTPVLKEGEDTKRTQEALSQVLDFGGRIEIPDSHLDALQIEGAPELDLESALSGEGTIEIASIDDDTGFPITAMLGVTGPTGKPIAQLAVTLTHRTSGRRGSIIYGTDITGYIQITMQTDEAAQKVGINLTTRGRLVGVLPTTVAPALHLLVNLEPGHTSTLRIGGHTVISEIPNGAPFNNLRDWLNLHEDLIAIQRYFSTYFPMPDVGVDVDVINTIRTTRRLIDNESVPYSKGPVTFSVYPEKVGELLELVKSDGALLITTDNLTASIGDYEIPLGKCHYYAGNTRLTNKEELQRTAREDPDNVKAVFEILGDQSIYLTRAHPDGDDATVLAPPP